MHLTSDRLILRPFRAADGQDLFEYLSDPAVVRYEPYGVFSREEAQGEAVRRSGDPNFLAVVRKGDCKLIGNLYCCPRSPPEIMTYEIGYVFNRHFQGQGYATEAASALVDFLFEKKRTHRITAGCNTDNLPSVRLLERLGFRREATRLQNMFFERNAEGEPLWFDSHQYALLRSEWLTGPQ